MSEIKTQETSWATCPYCGNADPESETLPGDDGVTECALCGEKYLYTRVTKVTYYTEPMGDVKEVQP